MSHLIELVIIAISLRRGLPLSLITNLSWSLQLQFFFSRKIETVCDSHCDWHALNNSIVHWMVYPHPKVYPPRTSECDLVVLVQLLSHVRLFKTPWTAARQASLSLTISWSSPKFMSTESVMPSNHLTLCCPLLLLPSIFPIIKVFFNESTPSIRWPKYWHFSISPSNEYSGLISIGLTGLISLLSKGLSRVFSSTTTQKHKFNIQPYLWSISHIHTWLLEKP